MKQDPTTERAELLTWLGRVGLSLLIGLAAGAMAYLVSRGIASVVLFIQQQQFFADVAGALRGGIEGLAGSDLRSARLQVQQLDSQYRQISLIIGFGMAALATPLSYLRLERRESITASDHSIVDHD